MFLSLIHLIEGVSNKTLVILALPILEHKCNALFFSISIAFTEEPDSSNKDIQFTKLFRTAKSNGVSFVSFYKKFLRNFS